MVLLTMPRRISCLEPRPWTSLWTGDFCYLLLSIQSCQLLLTSPDTSRSPYQKQCDTICPCTWRCDMGEEKASRCVDDPSSTRRNLRGLQRGQGWAQYSEIPPSRSKKQFYSMLVGSPNLHRKERLTVRNVGQLF